jgi:hypothetical protein
MKYENAIKEYLSQRKENEKNSEYKETAIRDNFHKLIEKIIGKEFRISKEYTEKITNNTIYYDAVLKKGLFEYGHIEDKD